MRTPGNAATVAIAWIVTIELSPSAIGPAVVAVTTPPDSVTVQPGPDPETYVMPAGSVSTRATCACVGPLPTFVAVSV